ncbi:MAG: YkgJ family cysteine cluster protein [Nitrospiraceae bacterium]|nr:YkgJ family cysteine cluster protein [Nitrospiraceae bacterium]
MNRPNTLRYQRGSAFSYTCHACSRCCHDKVIQLNPYETARLAANRGIGTTEFLSRYTEANGTALMRVEHGACVFLTAHGCGVHQDRPLVCRLYPLGRRVTAEGEESFSETTPHPQTEGQYGTDGTVEEFLTRQGAQPYIEAVDRYVDLLGRMAAVLNARVQDDAPLKQAVRETVETRNRPQQTVPEWMDMDVAVMRYCARHGQPAPSDVAGKFDVHLKALDEWLGWG